MDETSKKTDPDQPSVGRDTGIDRRRSERVSQTQLISNIRRSSESISQEKITGILRDISGSGLSFLSDGDYEVGDTLDLQIDLPGAQHHLLVQIVRIEVFGDSKIIGAYFINMASEHQKALLDALKRG